MTNPGFESGTEITATGWYSFEISHGTHTETYTYTVDPANGRGGGRALKLVDDVITDTHYGGARQIIVLDQAKPKPLYFHGWSKAECVSGGSDSNYSVYLDVTYTDGTPSYGHVLEFSVCSPKWQFRESFIIPEKPIHTVTVHCLLRYTHRGTVWFDDLSVQEVSSEIVFDSVPVTTSQPISQPDGLTFTLAADDGLTLTLAAEGGAITGVELDSTQVEDPNRAYASGFFVRDVFSQSNFIHVGGGLAEDGNAILHTSTITELNLDFNATYTATVDRIAIHAEVADTSGSERALTLYFALPISATEEWVWGDDIRTGRAISGPHEFASFSNEHGGIGATGRLSKYPWASLSGPPGSPLGLALAIPLDSPRVMRLIHNPVTNQFYVAFDLGLSPHTTKFPSRAWVNLIIYRLEPKHHFDGNWGFRSAAQGYYDRFPDAFARRIPPEDEGIWVAFSPLETITDVLDFGFAFHELGCLNQIPFDEQIGVLSFRYLIEPWSQWLPINDFPLTNPGFEDDPPGKGWEPFGSGYEIDPTGGRCGGQSLKLVNDVLTDTHGAYQVITLNQTEPRPLYLYGWNKAEDVTGDPDSNYSVYLDVHYTDDTWLYEQVLRFDTGTHDWQFRESFVIPTKPIQEVYVYCLLRNTHEGTAWFDDLSMWEIVLSSNQLTNPGFEEEVVTLLRVGGGYSIM